MSLSLSSRPEKTFLVEAGETCFRVDVRRSGKGYELLRVLRAKEEVDAHTEGIDAFLPGDGRGHFDTDWITELLKHRPRAARDIVVLSDRVTVVVAEIPGVGGEDWRSSAEMEAQTVSGLSSAESIFSAARLPSEAGIAKCWTVQTALRDVAALRSAVASGGGGCRLVSVGHPGGIRLDPSAPQLEGWSEVALFHGMARDRLDVRGWNGPDAFAEALEDGEVSSALAGGAGDEVRILVGGSGVVLPEGNGVSIVDLREDAAAEMWAARLADACDPLTGRILGMPVVNVPKLPPSPARLAGTAVGIGVVALLLMGAHYLLTERNKKALEADLERFKAPAEKLAASNRRITELRKQLKDAEKEEQDSRSSTDLDALAHRKRIGSLLDGIAAGTEVQEAVVMKVVPTGLDTMVSGAATTFNAPQELAGRIDESLSGYGWRAALVRRTAKLLRPDGGPWSYDIRLTPGRPIANPAANTSESATSKSTPADDGPVSASAKF